MEANRAMFDKLETAITHYFNGPPWTSTTSSSEKSGKK